MIARYRIPEGTCHRNVNLWKPYAEKAGIDFAADPKPYCYRDFTTGQYIIAQERADVDCVPYDEP